MNQRIVLFISFVSTMEKKNNTALEKMKRGDYVFFTLVFVGFYLLNQYSVLIGDDFWYCFRGVDAAGNWLFVNNFYEAIKSQCDAYMTHNGRIIVHTLTSYFCGVLGIKIFTVFNSLVFVFLFIGILRLSRKYIGYQEWDKYLIVFMLFFLMPYPGQIFLGSIAMSVNYLWTSCAIIYYVIFYEKAKRNEVKYNIVGNVILFIGTILLGSLQESFTIGLSGVLFLYYCFHIKEFKGAIVYMVTGFWIGTVIVVLAPGNFVRLEEVNNASNVSMLMSSLSNLARLFVDTKLLIICLVLYCVLLIKDKLRFCDFYKENFIYIWSIILNASVVLISYSGERQLTCIELFSLILIVKLLFYVFESNLNKRGYIYCILISFICLLVYYPIYNYRKLAFDTYNELANSDIINNTIVNRSYIDVSRRSKSNILFSRYTYLIDFEDWVYRGFSLLKSDGKDVNYVTAIIPDKQENIVEQFSKGMDKNGIYYDPDFKYYLFRKPINELLNRVKISSEPLTTFGKIRAMMLGRRKSYKIDITNELRFFDYNDYRYYIYYVMDYKVFDFYLD